jgi:glycosyltransferase involved in cell wall biosynthesis
VLTSIELDKYTPAATEARLETRTRLGLAPEDYVVIFAGRISPEKGIDILIRALRVLVERHSNCRLIVLGSPSAGADPAEASRYTNRLHVLAEHLPIFWIPRQSDVVPFLQASDVAVVPSLWAEPLSRSILEALACGIPVIASRVGGSPEILTGWMSEFLVSPGDPDELADRLVSLHGWRKSTPELGTKCRLAAESRMSLDEEVQSIERAMVEAMDRSSHKL